MSSTINMTINLRVVSFGIILVLLSAGHACSVEEDSLVSKEDANTRVIAAYLLKDSQCGTSHQLTIPVFADADSDNLGACVLQILTVDCSVWGSAENIPAACLAISINL